MTVTNAEKQYVLLLARRAFRQKVCAPFTEVAGGVRARLEFRDHEGQLRPWVAISLPADTKEDLRVIAEQLTGAPVGPAVTVSPSLVEFPWGGS